MSEQIIVKSIRWKLLQEDLETCCPIELKFYLYNIFLRLENWYKNNV
jgi:hypothetical protein